VLLCAATADEQGERVERAGIEGGGMGGGAVCAQKVKAAAEQLRMSSANRQTTVRAQLQKLAPKIMRVLSHVPSRVRESETEPFDDDVVLFLCARAPVVSEQMLLRLASVARIRHDDDSVCCSVLQCVAVCCSVTQCVAVCCSVVQCGAVWCNVF